MARYSISFEVNVTDATHKEVVEWLCDRLNYKGSIDATNPLCDKDIEAEPYTLKILEH